MKFIYGKNDWSSMERGQENCFLLTNGLGGFSSLTIIGSNARNDHAILMACLKAPNNRYNLISNIGETLKIKNSTYDLSSQEYLNSKLNRNGFFYESKFEFEYVPKWTYHINGFEINKTIAMKHGENTVGVKYEVNNFLNENGTLLLTPYLEFVPKGSILERTQKFIADDNKIQSNNISLNYKTNGKVRIFKTEYIDDILYSHDERDGRDKIGRNAYNHTIEFTIEPKSNKEFYVIYSTDEICETIDEMILNEINYRKKLQSQSKIKSEVGKMLAMAADDFIVNRESTNGKTVIAGYPFFSDWGRDTMIALPGLTLAVNNYECAKSILRTFMQYCKKGIMPNLFPEGENNAMYNTVDASLLFINTVYEYYMLTKDLDFIKEAYVIMEDIIYWYKNGTDFNIKMDSDGLIEAGSNLDQVTWMDVRINDILPTPRHGKPVEINAYWYNSLNIMADLGKILGRNVDDYELLALKVKKSFNEKFWNEEKSCLKDVVSDHDYDNQIRCNQIWAVSGHFSILSSEKERKVVDTVFEKLYTPYGLRTLSCDDPEFKGFYGGSQYNRDLAYHQGTTWVYPLGAYYMAYLKVNGYSKKSIEIVKNQLSIMEAALREGCIGQLPEIYDGMNPSISKGCFAQAWSVGEILRVYKILEVKGEETC
ncbi:MAG TPA: glycogen debranching protein [Clostridium sp.]|nr:glycogen debranching protein [Clostridium sp.]